MPFSAVMLALAGLGGCGKAPVPAPEPVFSEAAYDQFLEALVSGEAQAPAPEAEPRDKIEKARLDKAERVLGAVFSMAD